MSGERMPFPTNADVIRSLIEQHAGEMFVALPGTIQSYDAATQRADVVVCVRNPYPDPEGSGALLREDFPVVPHVKVLWPRMGSWFLAMSVQPGDKVQLLVNTLTIEDWAAGDGSVVDVGDTRRQHLAHAVALIGMEINSKALRHAPPFVAPDDSGAGLTLGSDIDDGTRQRFKGDGAVVVEHGTAPVFRIEPEPPPPPLPATPTPPPSPDFVALAAKVDAVFASLQSVFDGWTPVPNDGGAALKTALESWAVESVAAVRVKAT